MITFVAHQLFIMALNSLTALAIISQWTLFAGIGLVIFGEMEKKEKLSISGQICFLLPGIMAIWAIVNNSLPLPEIVTESIPKEVKFLSYFKLAAYFSVINLVALLLRIFKFRYYKLMVYLVVFLGLMLFFMVFNILQTPK